MYLLQYCWPNGDNTGSIDLPQHSWATAIPKIPHIYPNTCSQTAIPQIQYIRTSTLVAIRVILQVPTDLPQHCWPNSHTNRSHRPTSSLVVIRWCYNFHINLPCAPYSYGHTPKFSIDIRTTDSHKPTSSAVATRSYHRFPISWLFSR